MGNNSLHNTEKNLRSIAKRYENVKYWETKGYFNRYQKRKNWNKRDKEKVTKHTKTKSLLGKYAICC